MNRIGGVETTLCRSYAERRLPFASSRVCDRAKSYQEARGKYLNGKMVDVADTRNGLDYADLFYSTELSAQQNNLGKWGDSTVEELTAGSYLLGWRCRGAVLWKYRGGKCVMQPKFDDLELHYSLGRTADADIRTSSSRSKGFLFSDERSGEHYPEGAAIEPEKSLDMLSSATDLEEEEVSSIATTYERVPALRGSPFDKITTSRCNRFHYKFLDDSFNTMLNEKDLDPLLSANSAGIGASLNNSAKLLKVETGNSRR